ncbi:MAG: endolytic transglycosylase MltG [Candidatus Saganbacteria bacterium]|nr:endolytic transglycosylase MltG [Candidatus Saganbacteria bacterium]
MNETGKKIFFIDAVRSTVKRTSGYLKKNKFILIGLVFVAIMAVAVFLSGTLFLSKDPLDNKLIKVTVPNTFTTREIGSLLYLSGIIDNTAAFDFSAKMIRLDSRLKAGTYFFSPSMTVLNILTDLNEGRTVFGPAKLTIPEGSSIYKIARTIEKKGIMMDGSIDSLYFDGISENLRSRYPFLANPKTKSLEGYLFPDTYFVPDRMTVDALVELMLDRFVKVVMPVWNTSGIKRYSLHEVLTIASIVEKEAQVDWERPIIASVFLNRLENGMPLRADPTVKYALERPKKIITYEDLKVRSPYNTYINKGLPPGPICNPGLKSILATIYPARTNFIYFVSNGNGTHTFSPDWAGHAKAVAKYRKIRDLKAR